MTDEKAVPACESTLTALIHRLSLYAVDGIRFDYLKQGNLKQSKLKQKSCWSAPAIPWFRWIGGRLSIMSL